LRWLELFMQQAQTAVQAVPAAQVPPAAKQDLPTNILDNHRLKPVLMTGAHFLLRPRFLCNFR
jgi:hypothetical protein